MSTEVSQHKGVVIRLNLTAVNLTIYEIESDTQSNNQGTECLEQPCKQQ